MKALSVGLVKGSIDEVDKRVHMTWVQPRVLDLQQVMNSLNIKVVLTCFLVWGDLEIKIRTAKGHCLIISLLSASWKCSGKEELYPLFLIPFYIATFSSYLGYMVHLFWKPHKPP